MPNSVLSSITKAMSDQFSSYAHWIDEGSRGLAGLGNLLK